MFPKTSGFSALDMDLSPGLLSGLAQTSLLAYKDPQFLPSLLFMRNCLEDKHACLGKKMLKIYTHVEKCLFSPFSLYHRRVLFVITILHSPNWLLSAASVLQSSLASVFLMWLQVRASYHVVYEIEWCTGKRDNTWKSYDLLAPHSQPRRQELVKLENSFMRHHYFSSLLPSTFDCL